jgi:hypothetical protein
MVFKHENGKTLFHFASNNHSILFLYNIGVFSCVYGACYDWGGAQNFVKIFCKQQKRPLTREVFFVVYDFWFFKSYRQEKHNGLLPPVGIGVISTRQLMRDSPHSEQTNGSETKTGCVSSTGAGAAPTKNTETCLKNITTNSIQCREASFWLARRLD